MIVDKNIKSLGESVFLQLEEEILNGSLKKGDTLTETSLAQRLGVSRTPLRSAIHTLAEEGLVEIIPNKGATVVGVSRDDLIDIYKIRMRLEGIAAGLAAKRITPDMLSSLEESVELSEFYLSKSDSDHLKELDSAFHGIIYKASGSRHIAKILIELHRNIRSYRKLSLSVPSRLDKSVREHRAILEAIKSHNSELAEKLCCEHIEAALNNLLPVVDAES
ncbi:MAG: GntR family transcriptional regulator [Clostridia bacterium]|nr:GntR family transcriptional regulator [Clostridia bacterium]